MRPIRFTALAAAAALAALASLPAQALFKVVNPDGTVTYTDRPPQPVANTRVTNMARPGSPTTTEPDLSLPADLRQPAQKHPVTLYTTSECSPCDAGRQLLVARGVPYSERRVGNEEDAQAFERLFGTRTLPLLTVGAQPLKGLSDVEWAAYLDAAGYPKQARLPRGWQARTSPMVERAAPPTARVEAPVPVPNAPQINETETVSTGTRLRF
ncbi:MAG: glutaredoxin family protein [Betaproteobacteria bacterium]|nr:glutaredoxin family protein [Betaproteobacteria bacterium]MCC6247845.1 glutaredoxin family protein [Rubrivivax sp.]MCL4698624.1 glutaredoxin family protein [Burkholderiaceae bacterium]